MWMRTFVKRLEKHGYTVVQCRELKGVQGEEIGADVHLAGQKLVRVLVTGRVEMSVGDERLARVLEGICRPVDPPRREGGYPRREGEQRSGYRSEGRRE